MKAVSNLFIARSPAAIFWFLITCAAPLGTAWYVQGMISTVRSLPQFVITSLPTFQYMAPDLKTESVQQLHSEQTRLAMETIYNRGPSGLDHSDRRFKLFTDEVLDVINAEIIAPNVLMFRDTNSYQKVEISSIDVVSKEGVGEAITVAKGQLIRTGVEGSTMVNKAFNVEVHFTWRSNPSLTDHAMYPLQCSEVVFFPTTQTFP